MEKLNQEYCQILTYFDDYNKGEGGEETELVEDEEGCGVDDDPLVSEDHNDPLVSEDPLLDTETDPLMDTQERDMM